MKTYHKFRLGAATPLLFGLSCSLFSFAIFHSCGSDISLRMLCAPALFIFFILCCFIPGYFLFPDWIMIAWITILEMLFFEGMFYVFRCSESPHGRSGLRIVKLCFLVLVVFSCTSIWASDMMSEFGVFDWGWIEAMPKFNRHILSKFYLDGFIKELALDFLLAVAFLRLQRISLRKNNLVLN